MKCYLDFIMALKVFGLYWSATSLYTNTKAFIGKKYIRVGIDVHVT